MADTSSWDSYFNFMVTHPALGIMLFILFIVILLSIVFES